MAQEYSRAIARAVVAQLAANAGFERMQVSAVQCDCRPEGPDPDW